MRRFILTMCVAASMVSPVMADNAPPTGAWLSENCSEKGVNWSSGYCLGYINGVAEALNQEGKLVCFPPGVNGGQVQKIAVKYLEDHPEHHHLRSIWLVARALHLAFPCEQQP